MLAKFHYKDGGNVAFYIIEVTSGENLSFSPYVIFNDIKYLRKNILGDIEYEYEDPETPEG